LPTASSTARGELRGSVPLFHVRATNDAPGPSGSSLNATSSSIYDAATRKKRKKRASLASNYTHGQRTGSSALLANPRAPDSSSGTVPVPPSTSRSGSSNAVPSRPKPSSAAPAHPSHASGATSLPSTSQSSLAPVQPFTLGAPFTPTRPRSDADTAQLWASPLVESEPFQEGDDNEDGEAALLRQFNVDGADTYELLDYDREEDEDDEDYEDDAGTVEHGDEADSLSESDDDADGQLRKRRPSASVPVWTPPSVSKATAVLGAANTRCDGTGVVNEFTRIALAAGEIDDPIVDEHSLLLFIKFCAERPKCTRKGVDIPGTFLGASQLKRLFFGVLRIRKEQDAADPLLASTRLRSPASFFHFPLIGEHLAIHRRPAAVCISCYIS